MFSLNLCACVHQNWHNASRERAAHISTHIHKYPTWKHNTRQYYRALLCFALALTCDVFIAYGPLKINKTHRTAYTHTDGAQTSALRQKTHTFSTAQRHDDATASSSPSAAAAARLSVGMTHTQTRTERCTQARTVDRACNLRVFASARGREKTRFSTWLRTVNMPALLADVRARAHWGVHLLKCSMRLYGVWSNVIYA